MPIIGTHSPPQRSDEEYFRLWMELGTLEKVRNHLKLSGEVNPKTGKPVTGIVIRQAALRYIVEHPEIARQAFEQEYHMKFSDKEWDEYLVKSAMSAYYYNWRKFVLWVNKNGMQKYSYLYSTRIPDKLVESTRD
jgi:hypothetical protein